MIPTRLLSRAALLAGAAVVLWAATATPTATQTRMRVVAVGDVHGAFDQFTSILRRARLIDDQQRWAGGRSRFVQTGDFTDRGARVRQVMDLMMSLEQEARRFNGQVTTLLGNHEVMNLVGDLRDATPEIFATFADTQSESRRLEAWEQYASLAKARLARGRAVPVYQQTREEWLAAHPLGWLEYRAALGPKGNYGRWLRSKSIAAVIDDMLFMHAGINPDHPSASVDEVNKRARREIERFDAFVQTLVDRKLGLPFFTLREVVAVAAAEVDAAVEMIEAAKKKGEPLEVSPLETAFWREAADITKIGESSLFAPEGPLWFRGHAQWPEAETTPKVTGLLNRLKLTRLIVGHTPTPTRRVAVRYGGRVLVIDTGMLTTVYDGRPSAVEIGDGTLTAIYLDSETPLVTPELLHPQAARE